MSKPPVSSNNTTTTDHHLQTWILKVYIHCEGCRKKVFKVLQSIDGVYKTVIDSKQHKATVTGSVNGDTLVQKLLKSGKHAEILPESFEAPATADNASGNQKKKKKKKKKTQSNKQDGVTKGDITEQVHGEKEESEGVTIDGSDGENNQKTAEAAVAGEDGNGIGNGNGGGSGKKKKNKKKKGDKNDNAAPPNGDTESLPTEKPPAENVEASMEQLNLGRPAHQMLYATPYDLPPYHNYYPTPAYGVSYSTSYPSAESSYYTPPVYGYAQSHPSVSYPLRPPTSYYGRSAFDDHDDDGGEGRGCTIM